MLLAIHRLSIESPHCSLRSWVSYNNHMAICHEELLQFFPLKQKPICTESLVVTVQSHKKGAKCEVRLLPKHTMSIIVIDLKTKKEHRVNIYPWVIRKIIKFNKKFPGKPLYIKMKITQKGNKEFKRLVAAL